MDSSSFNPTIRAISSVELPDIETLPDSFLKRAVDVFLASVGLVVLSPLLLFFALLAKLQSPGRAIFPGPRVGYGGKVFKIYKFRTMVADAPKLGAGVTASNDPRITPVGRFLRNTKLDELPQIFNVLNGTMSIVGPRPELPQYVSLYDERQRRVLSVRPGITGPTQIRYRHEAALLARRDDPETYYVAEVMPAKLEIDLRYIERRSVLRDIGYMLQTLYCVAARSKGAKEWLP